MWLGNGWANASGANVSAASAAARVHQWLIRVCGGLRKLPKASVPY